MSLHLPRPPEGVVQEGAGLTTLGRPTSPRWPRDRSMLGRGRLKLGRGRSPLREAIAPPEQSMH